MTNTVFIHSYVYKIFLDINIYYTLETGQVTKKERSTHIPVHCGSQGDTGCSKAPEDQVGEGESGHNLSPRTEMAHDMHPEPTSLKQKNKSSYHTPSAIKHAYLHIAVYCTYYHIIGTHRKKQLHYS